MAREEELQAIPVALFPGGPKNYIVSAMLHRGGTASTELDLGLHGATYNGSYFYSGPYSMMAAAVRRGRDMLVIDRLGAGMSTRPHSRELYLENSVFAIHQVIEWARDLGYQRFNFIGDGLGGMLAVATAAAYPGDAASLVLTGVRHGHLPNLRDAASASVVAMTDPLLKGQVFDPGYVTVAGKIRGDLMYWGADQGVIDFDNDHRDVVSMTEFGEAVAMWLAPSAGNISTQIAGIRVHVIFGDRDRLFTRYKGAPDPRDQQAILRCEQPYWPDVQSLRVTAVPAGHSLNGHRSAPRTFDAIYNWLQDISEPAIGGSRTAPAAR